MIKNLLIIFLFISYTLADAIDVCEDEGSHSNDWWFVPELTWIEIIVGIVIVIFTAVALLPQIIKIIRKRSSLGISPFYILMITVNSVCGFINSTILNFPYMDSCPHVGYGICIPALLSWMQFLASTSLYLLMHILFFVFFDDKKSKMWKFVIVCFIFYLLFLGGSIVLIVLSVTVIDSCSTFTLLYARVAGIAGVVLVCIQFLPQIYTTYKNKTSGSLSLFSISIQAVGMIVIIIFMAFSTGQDFTAYLRFIVSCIIQSILASMLIYYDYIIPKCCKRKVAQNAADFELIEEQIELGDNLDVPKDIPRYNEEEDDFNENEKKHNDEEKKENLSSSSSSEKENEQFEEKKKSSSSSESDEFHINDGFEDQIEL